MSNFQFKLIQQSAKLNEGNASTSIGRYNTRGVGASFSFFVPQANCGKLEENIVPSVHKFDIVRILSKQIYILTNKLTAGIMKMNLVINSKITRVFVFIEYISL